MSVPENKIKITDACRYSPRNTHPLLFTEVKFPDPPAKSKIL
jgi:hypothetical protein